MGSIVLLAILVIWKLLAAIFSTSTNENTTTRNDNALKDLALAQRAYADTPPGSTGSTGSDGSTGSTGSDGSCGNSTY